MKHATGWNFTEKKDSFNSSTKTRLKPIEALKGFFFNLSRNIFILWSFKLIPKWSRSFFTFNLFSSSLPNKDSHKSRDKQRELSTDRQRQFNLLDKREFFGSFLFYAKLFLFDHSEEFFFSLVKNHVKSKNKGKYETVYNC